MPVRPLTISTSPPRAAVADRNSRGSGPSCRRRCRSASISAPGERLDGRDRRAAVAAVGSRRRPRGRWPARGPSRRRPRRPSRLPLPAAASASRSRVRPTTMTSTLWIDAIAPATFSQRRRVVAQETVVVDPTDLRRDRGGPGGGRRARTGTASARDCERREGDRREATHQAVARAAWRVRILRTSSAHCS